MGLSGETQFSWVSPKDTEEIHMLETSVCFPPVNLLLHGAGSAKKLEGSKENYFSSTTSSLTSLETDLIGLSLNG